jgi:hypothetical protein
LAIYLLCVLLVLSDPVLHASLVRDWPLAIRPRHAQLSDVTPLPTRTASLFPAASTPFTPLGLFCTRDVRAGEMLWQEVPVVSVGIPQQEEENFEDQLQQHATIPSPRFCALCSAPLLPPAVVDEHGTALPHAFASIAPQLLQAGVLDRRRTPVAATVACPSCTPSHPAHLPDAPPCAEQYCSVECSSSAWRNFHRFEHMRDEDVQRFSRPEMQPLLSDADASVILTLLMRIVAMLEAQGADAAESDQLVSRNSTSDVAPTFTTSDSSSLRKAHLSLLDHLSHLSTQPQCVSHFLSDKQLSALETAVAPMLQRALFSHPDAGQLLQRICSAGAVQGSEPIWLLRNILGALVTNSFEIQRTEATVLLSGKSATKTLRSCTLRWKTRAVHRPRLSSTRLLHVSSLWHPS